ncbi:ribonuclease Z [Chelativorans sp. M5D2P16]|uniref:ribonuclease Z n=1 Tax=Chelativorans sp. M5D2P16 TaxID=3095678 RepID=UPI002AC9F5EA|nr:MBL fold metallo-hydrolase [Chelativorans sp. M5D2P16]MDZ5699992.1 MBL fold metallo-hydrolase [Chelativorans sp. M5D2P16]
MSVLLVQPRLAGDPFADPVLYLDFRFGRRALLFDIGDLAPLSPREIARVTQVFVSHMHMDHFAAFDRLLRLSLYRDARIDLVGPPGLANAVESKLRAYTWNLLDAESRDFSLSASDWAEGGFMHASLFRARDAFRRQEIAPPSLNGTALMDDPEFTIEAASLDHGVPSLAFAFQEKTRVNVHKARLDALGLPVGPWLTEAKRSVRRGDLSRRLSPADGRQVTIRDLLEAGALRTGAGQRIAYATDLAFTELNTKRLVALAHGADRLYIEAGFLEEDRLLAASKKHLTAAQAGSIARLAGVAEAVPMHFSPRYADRADELKAEFASAMADG